MLLFQKIFSIKNISSFSKKISDVQANKRRRSHSASQLSLDSVGTVPDLTDRVVRVSFAPAGGSSAPAVSAAAAGPAAGAEDEVASTSTPAYDTLSVRSTTSTEPPEYQAATQLA